MARIQLAYHANDSIGGYRQLGLQNSDTCSIPWWYPLSVQHGGRLAQYVPAGILSSRAVVSWRFHDAPLPDNDPNSVQAPVSTTQYLPRGLSLHRP